MRGSATAVAAGRRFRRKFGIPRWWSAGLKDWMLEQNVAVVYHLMAQV